MIPSIYETPAPPQLQDVNMTLTPLSKTLLGVVATLMLAWSGWATNAILETTKEVVRTETRIERLPVIEQKLDLVMERLSVPNPSPLAPLNPQEGFPARTRPTN